MVTAERRVLSFNEFELIAERLKELRDREGSEILKLGEPYYAAKSLVHMSIDTKVIVFKEDGRFIGLLAFDVVKEWWTPKPILTETIILSMSDDVKGFARIAIDKLKELAEFYDVAAIVAGCLFQKSPQVVTNSYKKKGFDIIQPVYIKMRED